MVLISGLLTRLIFLFLFHYERLTDGSSACSLAALITVSAVIAFVVMVPSLIIYFQYAAMPGTLVFLGIEFLLTKCKFFVHRHDM